jgi:hypothetical protein
MKTPPSRIAQADASDTSSPQPKRRQLVVGAGVAAGAAIATVALRQKVDAPAPVAKGGAEGSTSEGYRLTDHIRRYYETTRS